MRDRPGGMVARLLVFKQGEENSHEKVQCLEWHNEQRFNSRMRPLIDGPVKERKGSPEKYIFLWHYSLKRISKAVLLRDLSGTF